MALPHERIHIGTSGWSYDSWAGSLYPSNLPKKNWLKFYGSRFGTAEINSSFYRTPSREAVASWSDQTPDSFLFSWKASKFITHWKRLTASCDNSIALMETRLQLLELKLGVVLFQLPPQFLKDTGRLEAFLEMLPACYRYAFEFRHTSWYQFDVFDILTTHNVSLCISDHADAPAPWQATARHVYIRGHGPKGNYAGHYSRNALRSWATCVLRWSDEGRQVFVYFDNDQKAAAPQDAHRLLKLVANSAPPKGKENYPTSQVPT